VTTLWLVLAGEGLSIISHSSAVNAAPADVVPRGSGSKLTDSRSFPAYFTVAVAAEAEATAAEDAAAQFFL